jgi:hypothetical protein
VIGNSICKMVNVLKLLLTTMSSRFRFIIDSGVRACEFGITNASNMGRKSLSRFRDTIADSG